MAVVDLSQCLLSPTAAQISCDPAKSLHAKQCENTQQGEQFLDNGTTPHPLRTAFMTSDVKIKADGARERTWHPAALYYQVPD